MSYEKPTLHSFNSAAQLIRTADLHQKPAGSCNDGDTGNGSSNGAYEVDE